ncbi:MAG: molybdenum cofactor biosynthesis protein [Euryarchaeota archaeon]|nr:molybdenum cofactor biosynthesis protein [Euryarchaeota archaeon]
MRPFRDLIPFEKARQIVLDNIRPVMRMESVPLTRAAGRVLAEDIRSEVAVPPFSRAAEDGYAVRAEDTYGAGQYAPKELKIVGRINTGEGKELFISEGEAVEVATGALIPEGADAVVRVEDTERDGEVLRVYRPVHPGFDIAPAGEDIKKGEVVLKEGALLTPARVGALAAIGVAEVKVYSRPRVAILPSGDELVRPGSKLERGKIYDVNSYTLASVVEQNGGEAVLLDYVRDEYEDIESKLLKALEYDVVVFSGGSSVGERDLLVDVVSKHGEIKFHGVQIKPGKPTWFALIGDVAVFGMPGFPTSCLNDAYQFLVPALRRMAHLPMPVERVVQRKMARRITSTLGRMQFFTVRIDDEYAYPAYKTSGAITSLANSDGYIVIPATSDLVEKDEVVEVHLWG